MPPTAWPLPREVREIETLIEPLPATLRAKFLAFNRSQELFSVDDSPTSIQSPPARYPLPDPIEARPVTTRVI